MNEETSKKILRKKAREEQAKKQRSFADKLKTEEDKRTYVGDKLRVGKADLSETRAELLENTRVKMISKSKALHKTYELAAISKNKVSQAISVDSKQDNNEEVASNIVNDSAYAVQNAVEEITPKYSKKLHEKRYASDNAEENANVLKHTRTESVRHEANRRSQRNKRHTDIPAESFSKESKEIQKIQMKKRIQNGAYGGKTGNKSTQTFGGTGVGDKIKEFFSNIEKKVVEWISENPLSAIIAFLLLIIVLVVCGTMSSCSMLGGGASDATIATSFTADDEDILAVDDDYTQKEEELLEYLEDFETNNPDYDEYEYILDEIGHNPFELAALLTVLYESYTESEVQDMLTEIYKKQYVITITERTEPRTKTVYDETLGTTRTEEFEVKIALVQLENKGIGAIIEDMNLSEDELARYELLIETYGNKRYLFEEDIYAIKDAGEFENYKIPAEFLTDAEFAKMIKEAEKYLGKKYVWGGSNPDEGFDCSGFVSYVINHSGNGINVGRPTANGLVSKCTKISGNNAKPGDLVFFKNTYKGAPSGASHVGIYVGNGMMIHCGNPIQYTSIETPFWQNHLYTYGRLDH